jgi:hypothetical protein
MKKQLFAIVLILSYKLNGVGLSVAYSKPKPLYSRVKSAVYNPIKSIPLKYKISTEVITKYVNVPKSNFSYKLDGDKEDIYTCDYKQIPTTGDYSFDSFSGTSLKVNRKFSRPPSEFVLFEKFTLNNCTKKLSIS